MSTSGDESFDGFFRVEYANVYRAALTFTGDKEGALDATQEAFSRAFARWSRLSRQPWVGGWVMTTALNLCRSRSQVSGAAHLDQAGQHGLDPDLHIDLESALRTLPLRQRQALLLHYLADLPVAVVADLMGISEGTVKTHLARGRQSLSHQLASIEGESRL
jgi:RNA polymerase sigma-70 factor (ECF subfamily)